MDIPTALDEVVQPHSNRKGSSIGRLTCLWLSFILSESEDQTGGEVETNLGQRLIRVYNPDLAQFKTR